MFSALIIDADESATGTIEGALEPLGFEFTRTHEAPEAMQIARSATPDIIFLRVELPTVSGFSVCNKLRRNDETRYIPLVMYASEVTDDVFEQHRNLKTHADEYLKLPFDSSALLEAVESLIEIRHPPDAPDGDQSLEGNDGDDLLEALDVEIDDVLLEENDEDAEQAGLSMAEFDQEFADIEGSEPKAVPESLGLSEETDAAFDALTVEESMAHGRVQSDIAQAESPVDSPAQNVISEDTAEDEEISFEEADLEIDDAMDGFDDVPLEGDTMHSDAPEEESPLPPPPESASSGQDRDVSLAGENYGGDVLSTSEATADEVLTGIPANEAQPRGHEVRPSEVETVPGMELPEDPGNEFQAQRETIRLKGQLNAKNREILTLKEELESQQRAILDAQRKNRELQFQLGELEEKLLRNQEESITAREMAEAAQRDKSTALKREEGLKNRLDISQKRIKELETTLEATNSRMAAESEDLTQEVARLQGELSTARESENSLSLQFENLRGENIELTERLEATTHKTAHLSETIAELEQELANARRVAQDSQEENQAILMRAEKEKQEALRALTQEHQAELEFEENQHQSESERLRHQMGELEGESQRLRAELQALQEHSQTRESQLGERIGALEADVSQLSDTLTAVENELRERRDAGERAQQALAVALRVLDGQTSA